MEGRKCLFCGERHWTNQPCPTRGAPRASGLQEQFGVTERGTSRVTHRPPKPSAGGDRVEELEAEVKQLKRALAAANLKLAERVTEKPGVTEKTVTEKAGVSV